MNSGRIKPARLGCIANDCYRTISEARLTEMLLLGGWAFEVAAGDDANVRTEVAASIERWIGLGLGYRRNDCGERLFDPVEVVNLMIWAGSTGIDPFWIARYVHTGRRLVAEAAPGADPSRHVRMRLTRHFDLRPFEVGAQIRLRLPLPLAGAGVETVSVTPIAYPPGSGALRCGDGRMEVRLAVPHDRVAMIGAEFDFITHRATVRDTKLDPAEAALYLRPTEGLIRVSPRIRALADRLAGGTTDPMAAVRSFWSFMMDHLCSGMVHYDQIPPEQGCEWVLYHGWFDCQLGSALLVALCRARRIPARIVGGHVLYRLAPTNHFWAEAWIEGRGWTPFDLLSWALSAGGRDAAWRHGFFATLDFRLITQILPLSFTGPMSVRFPARWQMIQTTLDDGIAIAFSGLDGVPVFEDRVAMLACGG